MTAAVHIQHIAPGIGGADLFHKPVNWFNLGTERKSITIARLKGWRIGSRRKDPYAEATCSR